jgi:hypothetical protein
MASRKHRLSIHEWDGVTVIDLGPMDIWDGADMALLRETLTRLVDRERRRAIGVNMAHVKYIPSGFFGMLFDWHDRGVAISLFTPQANVARMLWFRQFFDPAENGRYTLRNEPREPIYTGDDLDWEPVEDEAETMQPEVVRGRP